ncbi:MULTISPECIES: TIGR02391 family protein [Xanthomonas]|uniref:TIGR02391 family protein n=1 Tax=Xanthomonas TaxID=338 RepID=UPI001CB7A3DD|nr:TIGR02391 family protein [Xanthomonas cucurbitae]
MNASVPNIWKLLNENYFHAVFESDKGVAERLRLMSGLATDGVELVNRARSTQNPILVLGSLAIESDKSEQKGFANLLVGLFGAVRNPLAHAPKTNWPMFQRDALDILTLVSLIHRKLDRPLETGAARRFDLTLNECFKAASPLRVP